MRRVLVPVMDDKGLDSRLSAHFGRAPYFALVELDEEGTPLKVEVLPNEGEHFGFGRKAKDIALSYGPDAVIVLSIGPGAIEGLKGSGIKVLRGRGTSLRDVLSSFARGELEELNEACKHPKHGRMH